MCKSYLYTALTTDTSVAAGGTIPAGSAVHGFGSNIKLNGTGVTVAGAGYYNIVASITAAPVATGGYTVTAYANGLPITGATATAPSVTAGEATNVSVVGCVYLPCNCLGAQTITFVVDNAVTVNNMTVAVEKE